MVGLIFSYFRYFPPSPLTFTRAQIIADKKIISPSPPCWVLSSEPIYRENSIVVMTRELRRWVDVLFVLAFHMLMSTFALLLSLSHSSTRRPCTKNIIHSSVEGTFSWWVTLTPTFSHTFTHGQHLLIPFSTTAIFHD